MEPHQLLVLLIIFVSQSSIRIGGGPHHKLYSPIPIGWGIPILFRGKIPIPFLGWHPILFGDLHLLVGRGIPVIVRGWPILINWGFFIPLYGWQTRYGPCPFPT